MVYCRFVLNYMPIDYSVMSMGRKNAKFFHTVYEYLTHKTQETDIPVTSHNILYVIIKGKSRLRRSD
jgi:hypothetical protein